MTYGVQTASDKRNISVTDWKQIKRRVKAKESRGQQQDTGTYNFNTIHNFDTVQAGQRCLCCEYLVMLVSSTGLLYLNKTERGSISRYTTQVGAVGDVIAGENKPQENVTRGTLGKEETAKHR
jgi:hypothetical protein